MRRHALFISMALVFLGVVCAGTTRQPEEFPRCVVDLNRDTVFEVPVPERSYRQEVLPAIEAVSAVHSRAFLRYTLPAETLWTVAGMKALLGRSLSSCCESCAVPCADSVILTKPSAGSSLARFELDLRNVPNPWVVTDNRPGYDAAVNLPTKITGRVVISPGLVELFFDRPPQLSIAVNSSDVFNGGVFCTSALPQWSVIRNAKYLGSTPAVHVRIQPQ
jgi:hypothetical protein